MSNLAYEYKLTRVQEVGSASLLDGPEEALEYWRSVIELRSWYQPNREHVIAIHLNTRCIATGHHLVGIGTLDQCTAHPRDILGPALCASAHSIIMMHNHPSGDPTPSRADIAITRAIREGGDLLRVQLRDHVIVGGADQFYSFLEAGLI